MPDGLVLLRGACLPWKNGDTQTYYIRPTRPTFLIGDSELAREFYPIQNWSLESLSRSITGMQSSPSEVEVALENLPHCPRQHYICAWAGTRYLDVQLGKAGLEPARYRIIVDIRPKG